MRVSRRKILGIVGLGVLLAVAGSLAVADTAAYYEPPAREPSPARAKLVADRQHGFAPMTVTLAGMLESRDGVLLPIEQAHDVVLLVDSPFLHLRSGSGSRWIATDFHYEARMSGPDDAAAFIQAVELKRPGRYVFRIQVLDEAGQVLRSNEVTVKAM